MNKVDELLQAIVRYDAKNAPYTLETKRQSDKAVIFRTENRRLHVHYFNDDSGACKLSLAEEKEGVSIILEPSHIGPTVLERIYPYLLWVMGVK